MNAPARRRGPPQGPRRRETFVARAVAGIVRQMARALPHLFRTTGFLALCLAAAAGLGCNSDDPISTLGPIDLTTTGEETTMIFVFTTGEPDLSTSTGEPPKPEATCRDALACLITCAINLPNPTPPEQDYGCFIDCQEGLTTEEVLDLIRLSKCVGQFCTADGKCSNEPGADNSMCQSCLIVGLSATKPPVMGCEAEAMACK